MLCYFGILVGDICIWVLIESRIKQLIFKNDILACIILEVSYFLVPLLAAKFFMCYKVFGQKTYMKWLYTFSKIQFIIVQIMLVIGYSTSKCNFLMQISSLALAVAVLYTVIKIRKFPEKFHEIRTLLYGLVVLCIGCFLELVKFFLFSKLCSGVFILLGVSFFTYYYGFKTVHEFLLLHIESMKKNTELQITLEANSIKMKVAQMHPHFLYNALSTIQTIIKVNPDYAYQLLYDFTIHLRGTVKSLSSDDPIPFSEELKHIKAYLNIEQMRFGDSLKVVYDIRCDSFLVAPLVIQPLAENAARHGIFERGTEGGIVTIRTYEEADRYVIQVLDTGMGFDVEKILEGKNATDSVGMKNIIFRLEKLLQAKVEIDSVVGVGTTVTVFIPKGESEVSG